jgi:dsRNA-specific ribonuclease
MFRRRKGLNQPTKEMEQKVPYSKKNVAYKLQAFHHPSVSAVYNYFRALFLFV